MIAEIIKSLKSSHPNAKITCIALTTGQKTMKQHGIPFLGFKDFTELFPSQALEFGINLSQKYFNTSSGIDKTESIAYLGLSYWDLITREGKKAGEKLFKTKQRHAFLPTIIMGKILDLIQPNAVITTNAPRAELAAVREANLRKIPTISMVDLFGWQQFLPLEAQHIIVQSDATVKNMIERKQTTEKQQHHIIGNPAFDKAIRFVPPAPELWMTEHFESINPSKPIFCWIDTPAYWNKEHKIYHRTENEILSQLEDIKEAAIKNSAQLIIRPHPSQNLSLYKNWIEQNKDVISVYLGHECDLYPLITSSDICLGLTSTALLEAVYLGAKVAVIKLKDFEENSLPLAKMGLVWELKLLGKGLAEEFNTILNNKSEWARINKKVQSSLPKELSSPRIVDLVYKEAYTHFVTLNA